MGIPSRKQGKSKGKLDVVILWGWIRKSVLTGVGSCTQLLVIFLSFTIALPVIPVLPTLQAKKQKLGELPEL